MTEAEARTRIEALRRLRRARLWSEHTREVRGLTLLKEWLSDQQRAQFDAHGYFDVVGSDSGKRYRIKLGWSGNVFELDRADRTRCGWCFVPSENLVPGDVMLAQKVALETNECGALAVARNFSWQESAGPSALKNLKVAIALRGDIPRRIRMKKGRLLHQSPILGREMMRQAGSWHDREA